jgi:hypothetical protein
MGRGCFGLVKRGAKSCSSMRSSSSNALGVERDEPASDSTGDSGGEPVRLRVSRLMATSRIYEAVPQERHRTSRSAEVHFWQF